MHFRAGIVLCLLLALGVAGCGGGGTDGVATAGGQATGRAKPGAVGEQENALKFSQCMRDNGVPNFPDPKVVDGGGIDLSLPEGIAKEKVDAAQEKCKWYLPNGGEPVKADPKLVERLREFSRCMRENGFPNFPDPTDQGLQIENDKLGITGPDDPRFNAAQKTCEKYMPAPPSGETPQNRSNG